MPLSAELGAFGVELVSNFRREGSQTWAIMFSRDMPVRKRKGSVVARKNFYASGSLWSGRLAAMMFSLFATLVHWKLNPRRWLTWYFESCAAVGGKGPEDIQPFLHWNLSNERRLELGKLITALSANNTSWRR